MEENMMEDGLMVNNMEQDYIQIKKGLLKKENGLTVKELNGLKNEIIYILYNDNCLLFILLN